MAQLAVNKLIPRDDSEVLALSARALGEIGTDAAGAVPAIIAALARVERGNDESRDARRNFVEAACYALERIGPASTQAVPILTRLATDRNGDESIRPLTTATLRRISAEAAAQAGLP